MSRNGRFFDGYCEPPFGIYPAHLHVTEDVDEKCEPLREYEQSALRQLRGHRRSFSLTQGGQNLRNFEGPSNYGLGLPNSQAPKRIGRPTLKSEADADDLAPQRSGFFSPLPNCYQYESNLQSPSYRAPPPTPASIGTPSSFGRTRIGSCDSDYVSPGRFGTLFPLNSSLADEFSRLFSLTPGSKVTANETSTIDEFRKVGKESEYLPDEGVEDDLHDDVFKTGSKAISPFVRSTPKAKNKKPEVRECVFCKNNGEQEAVYKSHTLKDGFGKVVCPILRKYVCPYCGDSGDSAHTKKYCDKKNKIETTFTDEMPSVHYSRAVNGIQRLKKNSTS